MAAQFARVLGAEPVTPSLLRRAFRDWLRTLHWPAEEADDLILAVSEAATNVVEHAYPRLHRKRYRTVRVFAERVPSAEGPRVRIEVNDTARWRPVPAEPGFRGRGLRLMRACTDALTINLNDSGTRVIMTSRPARLPHPVMAHRQYAQSG